VREVTNQRELFAVIDTGAVEWFAIGIQGGFKIYFRNPQIRVKLNQTLPPSFRCFSSTDTSVAELRQHMANRAFAQTAHARGHSLDVLRY
jgi:hypothetical protein